MAIGRVCYCASVVLFVDSTHVQALVSAPAILFLDEPTTGLSSTDSYKVMHEIKEKLVNGMGITVVGLLSCRLPRAQSETNNTNNTVSGNLNQRQESHGCCDQVAVIHQPRNSVFNLFDRFFCLCDGKMVYQGDRVAADAYFAGIGVNAKFQVDAHSNPADFFIDAITKDTKVVLTNPDGSTIDGSADPDMFKDEYGIDYNDKDKPLEGQADYIAKEVEQAKAMPTQGDMSPDEYDLSEVFAGHTTTSKWFQFGQLLKRDLAVAIRDPARLLGRSMNGLCLGLLIGILYKDVPVDQMAPWLLINLQLPAISTMVSMPIFYQERPFMNLERDSGLYTTAPYFFANACSLFLVSLVGNFFMITIAFSFSGFPWGFYPLIWATATLLYIAMDSLLGMCVMNTASQAEGLAAFNGILGVFFLFNGVSANTSISPKAVSWICYTSPIYYSVELGMTAAAKCDGFSDFDQELLRNSTTGTGTGQLDMNLDMAGRDVFLILGIATLARLVSLHLCDTKNRVCR